MKPDAKILLIEDNPADQKLILLGLKKCNWQPHIATVSDGARAINFLNRAGEYSTAFRPDIVILDLNLPVINGKEVLRFIRTRPHLKSLPVVIFTSSDAQREIKDAYAEGVNFYVLKKTGIDDYLAAVAQIHNYWLSLSELPETLPHEAP